tara:strand:- start:712 stop:1005 length:294 start_codon:yes stop_codon:yes gene_type:complete
MKGENMTAKNKTLVLTVKFGRVIECSTDLHFNADELSESDRDALRTGDHSLLSEGVMQWISSLLENPEGRGVIQEGNITDVIVEDITYKETEHEQKH